MLPSAQVRALIEWASRDMQAEESKGKEDAFWCTHPDRVGTGAWAMVTLTEAL